MKGKGKVGMSAGKSLNPIISFQDVSFGYAHEELFQGVNFSLEPGSFHYLTGASGAGKSSLLRLMYLAQSGFSGTIKLFNQNIRIVDPALLPAFRLKIGVVFQDFHLINHLSAVDNVSLPLRIQGLSPSECYRRSAELLDWVGLSDHLDSLPDTLSGGQQQRVVIARAVVAGPQIILADEPTGNVDDATAVRLMALFESLNAAGATVVLATHNWDLVLEFPHPELVIEKQRVSLVEYSLSSRGDVSLREQVAQSKVGRVETGNKTAKRGAYVQN